LPITSLVPLLALVTATGAAPSAFGPGEQIVMSVDYSGVTAGRAVITVGSTTKVGTQEVWPVVTVADTAALFSIYPLHDKFVTWWSPAITHGIGYDFSSNENGKIRRERCKLNSPASGKAQVQRVKEDAPPSQTGYDIDPSAEDIASAFFFLRSQPLVAGSDTAIPVFTGTHSWNMLVHANEPAPIEVPAGKFDSLPLDVEVHFQGKLESKRRLKVWVSNDVRHVLLRVEADLALGALHGELVEYHPGNAG
jgi:hypothetical protein